MSQAFLNVLLIEDNEQHVTLLRQMLARSGECEFRIHHYHTLAEGLHRIGNDPVDIILLDLTLPDSDGIATFSAAYEKAGDIPIIVLSGLNDEALAIETVHLGAQDYLVKSQITHQWVIRSMQYAFERKQAQLALQRANNELEQRVHERTADLQNVNARLQREIVERRRVEEALIESNGQLADALSQLKVTQHQVIQRERLHALGRMASGVAHDFNNALAPIVGFSELLLLRQDSLADPEKTRKYVQMIHAAAKESAKVVSRLRDFSRYREEAEVFVHLSLNDIVEQAIALTQPKWKDQALAKGTDIRIVTDFQKIREISGNETELREMLASIIFNSVDAITGSGAIYFRTSMENNSVVVQIRDTGAGMSEEVIERCLEPFYSTKEEAGSGLGLGIVYGIVRRHEGNINIESEPGRGTTVTITLPVYREESRPDTSIGEQPAPDSMRILVIEDEPLVRDVVSVYLKEDGHQIETAENGRIGLEKFAPGKFDLVLTDRAMPEMNGDQLAIAIKRLDPAMPVILLTGFGDIMSGAGERPEGVDLVVGKPFTMSTLRDAITRATAKK